MALSILDIPPTEDGDWRDIELLTIGNNPQYPLAFDCPSVFRRPAMRKAIGAYSWRSNYIRWLHGPKRLSILAT